MSITWRLEPTSKRPKRDSIRVIVVGVNPTTVTYEPLSGGPSVTESLGSFLATFRRDRA
jgi:hypothetical protein